MGIHLEEFRVSEDQLFRLLWCSYTNSHGNSTALPDTADLCAGLPYVGWISYSNSGE